MNTHNTMQHNDEIDLKEIFKTISKYKVSIIFITILFVIASSIFAYYKPNIYGSHSTIEILEKSKGSNPADIMLQAFGGGESNIDNEIAVIESRFVIQRALETLNLTTRYYSYNKLYKKTELYLESPFSVNISNIHEYIYGKNINIEMINDEKFRLIIKPVSKISIKGILNQLNIKFLDEEDKITYNEIHKFGEEISSKWFKFKIIRNNNIELAQKKYSFNFIQEYKLYEEYKANLSISQVSKGASVIMLSYQDNVSLRAKHILNAISKSYIYQGIEQQTKVAKLTIGFIDTQLDIINKELKSSASNLEKYKIRNDLVNLVGKAEVTSTKLVEYKTLLSEIQTEINILNNVKQFINKNEDISGLTIGTIKYADPTLANMIKNLLIITKTKNNLLIDYTKLHPEVIKLSKNIKSMKVSVKAALKSNIHQLMQRRKDLKKELNKYTQSLEQLPSQEKELASLARPLNVNKSIYEYLLQKKAETAILKSSTISNSRILDAARESELPIKPKRKLIVIVGFILGLIVGIANAFLREFLIYTVLTREEIEKLTDIPIYGIIPILKKTNISKNLFYESLRSIRTNLQFLPDNEKNQIISITSSVSGEGKTTITSGLAKMLAQSEKRVIILDLDLRKSSLHKNFDISNNIGLSSFLTHQNKLEDVIRKTKLNTLDIITTGPIPPNPSELILSKAFVELLDSLKEIYDYVIIDTPPAGLVTDAIILMNHSDISFFVVRADYTRKEFVKNIHRMSKDYADNKLGILFNGTKLGDGYGYGYGTSYANEYGNKKYFEN